MVDWIYYYSLDQLPVTRIAGLTKNLLNTEENNDY